jgi:GT2 family glycosyltransferase
MLRKIPDSVRVPVAESIKLRPLIAVPAHNEAQRLPHLLQSLARQSWCRLGHKLQLVIAINNTTDDSFRIVKDFSIENPNLEVEVIDIIFEPSMAHVGSARRLALDTAWESSGRAENAILLTTDADAQVTEEWVEANLAAIARGADVVGGEIVGDSDEEAMLGPEFVNLARLHSRYAYLADRMAAIVDPIEYDPLPRHCDHTGASLAVRGTVYEAVGRLPPLPFREDLAFVSRAKAAGFRIRHDPDVRVQVSARLVGRAAGGMADCLRAWCGELEERRPHLVEAPVEILRRLQRRRTIRSLLTMGEIARDGALHALGVPGMRVTSEKEVTALVELLAPEEPDASGTVPVEVAIAEIEGIIRAAEDVRHAA